MDAGASSEPIEPPTDQPAALLTALTTEQFVLQSAASTTVSESVGRASIYLSAKSRGRQRVENAYDAARSQPGRRRQGRPPGDLVAFPSS